MTPPGAIVGQRASIDAEFGDRSRVRLRAWLRPTETCLEVTPTWDPSQAQRIRIGLEPEPFVAGAPPKTRRWTMVAGLPPRWASWLDPFQWLTRIAGDAVFRGAPCDEEGSDCDRTAAPRIMRELRAAIRAAARHAALSCTPRDRACVLPFSPCMRWWLYRHLRGDPSGRLRQLTRSCPGALILGFALDEDPAYRHVAHTLLAGARAGKPLNALVDGTLEDWAAGVPSFIARRGAGASAAWEQLLAATGEDRNRLLRQQRLLIRRALWRVPPTLLLLPPPLQFAPEDIPRTTRANAHWFRVMKCSAATLRLRPEVPTGIQRGLSRFASRWAGAIRGTPRRDLGEIVRTLSQYCVAHRRVAHRETDPDRLVADAVRWSARLDKLARDFESESTPKAVLAVEFPVDDRLAWDDRNLQIRPLRTLGELLEEGREMRNCAASRARAVLGGHGVVCHATIESVPHTIEAQRLGDGWAIVQIRSFANASPTREAVAALAPWLEARGIRPPEPEMTEDLGTLPLPFATVPF